MTTVVDPSGTPAPVYTRSGTTIAAITAAGSDQGSATPLIHVSGWTVGIVTCDENGLGILLPSNAEIGDLVELIRPGSGYPFKVYPDYGSSIFGYSANSALAGVTSVFIRKTDASQWSVIGQYR